MFKDEGEHFSWDSYIYLHQLSLDLRDIRNFAIEKKTKLEDFEYFFKDYHAEMEILKEKKIENNFDPNYDETI